MEHLRASACARPGLCSWLCLLLWLTAARAEEFRSFSFVNPRLAEHVVKCEGGARASALDKGVLFEKEGQVTYRFSESLLQLAGTALEGGITVRVSEDGENWRLVGELSTPSAIDLDLTAFRPYSLVQIRADSGVLKHPPVAAFAEPAISPVFEIPKDLRGHLFLDYGAGETRGSPLAAPPDPLETPIGLAAEVEEAGFLTSGQHHYVIITTFDEDHHERYSVGAATTTGAGGKAKLQWPPLIGHVEILAKQARAEKAALQGALDLKPEGDEEEDDGEIDDAGLGDVEEKPKPRAEAFYYEIYRQDPGSRAARLVQKIRSDARLLWTDTGTRPPGKPLPRNIKLVPVIRRKLGKPYHLELEAQSHFGSLAAGTYYYRVAAMMAHGEAAATAPIEVVAPHDRNEVRLTWGEPKGALAYKIYRSRERDRFEDAFLAQVDAPASEFVDHGVTAPGSGISCELSVRTGAQEDLATAEWTPVAKGQRVSFAGRQYAQFRAEARSEPLRYAPGFVEVKLSREPRLEGPRGRIADVTYRWPSRHPWTAYYPALACAARGRSRLGSVIEFPERVRLNSLCVQHRAGLFHTRDYDLHVYDDGRNSWVPALSVRNNEHLLCMHFFEPVETRAVRFVTFGLPLFGAYAINMSTRGFQVAEAPVCVRELGLNGKALTDIHPADQYLMWVPVSVLRGRNEIHIRFQEMLGSALPLEIRVTASDRKQKGLVELAKRDVDVPAGGTLETIVDFSVGELPGLLSVRIARRDTQEQLYTFHYEAQLAKPLTLSLQKPDYRWGIFESQRDKSVVADVALGSAPEKLVGHSLQVAIEREGHARPLQEKVFDKIASHRLLATFDGSEVPCGSYQLVARLKPPDAKTIAEQSKAFHRYAPSPYGENVIGERGLIFCDGKPFFPLRMGGMGGPHFTSHLTDQSLQNGFNVTTDNLEEARARGMKIMPKIALPRDRGDQGWFKLSKRRFNTTDPKLIEKLGAHSVDPAVLAWYYGDEIDVAAEQKKDVSAYAPGYSILAEVDPYHPAMILLFDSNGFLGTWGRTCDVYVVEPYLYAAYSDDRAEVAARMKKIIIWTRMAIQCARRSNLSSRKAVWAYPMAWDHRVWSGLRDSRIPSIAETRCYVYTFINDGVTGFLFYIYCTSYFHLKMNPLYWEGLRAIVGEINYLLPALTGRKWENAVRVRPDSASISCALYEAEGEKYLIAANLEPYPVKADLEVSIPLAPKSLSVVSEDRKVLLEDGVIHDHFGEFQVHIYTTKAEVPKLVMGDVLHDPRYMRGPHRVIRSGNVASETEGATAKASHTIWWFNSAIFAIDDDPETCWNTSAWAKWGKQSGDWLEVNLAGEKTIDKVVLRTWKPKFFHDSDDRNNLVEDFDLEHWDEKWLPLGTVRGNEKEEVTVRFDPVSTEKIRVVIKKGLCVAELEAYEAHHEER